MKRQTNLKVLVAYFLALLAMNILGNPPSSSSSFSSTNLINNTGTIRDQTANNTLFMQKFQAYYDYIHSRYDTGNVAISHANLTADEYPHALSRWTLAWFPLLLTFAYQSTADAKYLIEAKYYVDALSTTTPYATMLGYHSLVIAPRIGSGGLLDADIPWIWAQERLNEYFGQTYDVTGYYSAMLTVAKYNNATDLAWASPWTNPTPNDVTFDEELMTASFLSYLTYKGVGNYTSDVQRMCHFIERYRVQNFYPYGVVVSPTQPRTDLTAVDLTYLLIAYHYLPSAINGSQLQATLNAYATTTGAVEGDPEGHDFDAMAELALWTGFNINQRLRTALYQALNNFQVNSLVDGLTVHQGERQNCVSEQLLLLALAYSGRTSMPSYVYGGYVNYPSHGVTNVFQLNNTISYNTTDIWGTALFEYQNIYFMQFWGGIDWAWDTFAYNSSLGYYQGYKAGQGSLTGNDLKIGVWESFKKVQANRTNYNTNGAYQDLLFYEYYADSSQCFLIFTNGTVYSLASGSTRTVIGSNPLAWYEPQNGYLVFYKINDNASATMHWTITVSGTFRMLTTLAKKYEAIPWLVPARNPSDGAVRSKAVSMLQDYASGKDMVKRDL